MFIFNVITNDMTISAVSDVQKLFDGNGPDEKDGKIVLPRPPNDTLKYCYVSRKRWLINTAVILSIGAMVTGLVLFANSVNLYFYYVFLAVVVFCFFGKLFVDTMSPNFNPEDHNTIVENVKNDPENNWAVPVDIFLPICGESVSVLINTWYYVSKMVYPGTVTVYVQNDGNETYEHHGEQVNIKELAEKFGFVYVSRPDKGVHKKSGNLRYCFQEYASGDLFVILDADFCPREDFLLETVPRFTHNPKLGILQTPQFFEMRQEQSWVERAAAVRQEVFYRVILTSRDTITKNFFKKYEPAGTAICVGSCAVYRREAFLPNGGTALAEASEDVRSGYYAITNGWELRYIPLNLSTGVCPDTIKAYFSQQYRWGSGSTLFAWSKDFWGQKCNFATRMNYLFGFMGYPCTVFLTFVGITVDPLVAWLSDPEHIMYYNIAWAGPMLITAYIVRPLWTAQKYPWSSCFLAAAQSWAYVQAILDRIVGSAGEWIPTGSVRKNNKYTIARVLCFLANMAGVGALVAGSVVRINAGHSWYNFLPMWIMTFYRVVCTIPFLFNMF
ncbi:cellulose synthase catalytic subunit (UDP-forming) [Acanthocystis turfacea Chlorella virus GM0701.1]|nr:cellulose synthase catalytic subunit (UDP-forming) [Acanthocystis turfacea Chlorella virus GM0701.1]